MRKFAPIFITSFFLSLQSGAILYINSSYLESFFSSTFTSGLFFAGAVATIALFLFIPRLIERFGKKPLLTLFLLFSTVSIIGMTFAVNALYIGTFFIIYAFALPVVYYCLDIYLEELSRDNKTGEVRGLYLTIYNVGIAVGPLILALFATDSALRPIYFISSFFFIPPLLLALFAFKSHMPKWHGLHHHALLPFKLWWKKKNVRRVTLARFVLEFFFVFMIIYTPVYLHSVLKFEWQTLGIMFTIMLLPFILFQWPVGEMADRFVGEKEFMILGFVIMIATVLYMPRLEANVIYWTILLFASRVGASLVEVTTDSYFFKHVDSKDTGLLSIFRLTRPVSFVFGTIVGILVLSSLSHEMIFITLTIVIFLGLKESLLIRDTL